MKPLKVGVPLVCLSGKGRARLIAALLCATPAAWGQNLVFNGGFDGTTADGWTVSSSYEYGNSTIGFMGYVLQDLQPTPGQDYLLSFDFIGAVQVSWGGAEVVAYNQHGH